jgi:CRP-like cAMP-binding protein
MTFRLLLAMNSSDATQVLASTWLFGEMMPEEQESLGRVMIRENKQIGDEIVSQGKSHSNLWILAEGVLEVRIGGQKVGQLKAGDMFGEQAWLEGIPASATIVCATPAVLWRVPFQRFDDFLGLNQDAHIHILRKLAINLSQRLRK